MTYIAKTWNSGDTITHSKLNDLEQAAAAALTDINAIAADPALRAAYVPKWQPSTAYASGDFVLNPSGQIVSANTAFTSGASYSGTNWTVVSGGGGTVSDATTSAKGIVQLAGDLAGTAAAPTVPALANKLNITDAASTYVAKADAIDLPTTEAAVAGMFTGGTSSGISFVYDQPNEHINATVTGKLAAASNLSDVASVPTARTNLGLATVAATGAYTDLSGKPTIPTVGAAGAGAAVALSSTDATTTNARTPTAHASTHASGGSDPLTPAAIGAASATVTQTTQTGTTYTFVLGDANTLVESNNAVAVTFTVPPNASVAFPVGTSISLRQYGAGQVTVAPGAAVTLRSRGSALKLTGQYAEATLTQRAADEWVLTGDVTP